MRIILFLLLFISIIAHACSSQQSDNQTTEQTKVNATDNNSLLTNKTNNMTNYFPFEIDMYDADFKITARIESHELFPTYADFFKEHGYSGNGYCWEGHIEQILEKKQPELLKHIRFDSEAGCFVAYADSKESQIAFVELLSPIFFDLATLEGYVTKADRSRIDD